MDVKKIGRITAKELRYAIEKQGVFVTDKELAKLYINAVVGEKYVVPTIKILKTVEEC